MKKIIALLLALLCLLPLNACAADASIQVTGAEAGRLELALDNVPESTLITGAYQDGRMIAYAFTEVLSGAATAVANFLGQLPDGVIYKTFVLDSQTATPLAPSTELTLPGGEKVEEPTVNKLQVSFNGHRYTATLEENPTAQAFVQLIQERGGSLTVSASDYSSFEKVAPLGVSLPADDQQTTTSKGDFVLYSSNQIVLFYGSNSWSYTRLGKLEGDLSQLKDHLGVGDVSITYALAS